MSKDCSVFEAVDGKVIVPCLDGCNVQNKEYTKTLDEKPSEQCLIRFRFRVSAVEEVCREQGI